MINVMILHVGIEYHYWRNVGVRCPTKGQQCALGGEKYNLVGFECKDEKKFKSRK